MGGERMGGTRVARPLEASPVDVEKQKPVVLLSEQELAQLEHLADRTENKNENAQDLLDEWRVATVASPLATGQSMEPEVLKTLLKEIRGLLESEREEQPQ